jgi:hypothetical protein
MKSPRIEWLCSSAGGPSARMCLSMIDQYAEDACTQHRTKHDIHRFKCVAVPHQNCPNVTTTVFKSWTFTGFKFSTRCYGIRS